jgi:hypothetical protein
MDKLLLKEYVKWEGFPQELKVQVYYDKGGWNVFSGDKEKRGYYLSVTPVSVTRREDGSVLMEETSAFSGIKILIKEVNRRSKKRSKAAVKEAQSEKKRLIEQVIVKNS